MADILSVLIVDEDQDSRVVTRRAIQRAQLNLAGEAGYGAGAVSFALSSHPDIILLAVEEPIGRPLETAEALANALPDTPFIMYSTMKDGEAVRRGMVFGARDYIVKPVQATRLLEAVNTVLEQQERRQMRRAGHLLDASGRGTVISVVGSKGGIGKSVICVNLAVALRVETGRAVAVFDADTDFGDVATLLDLSPSLTVADLLAKFDRIDRESIRGYLTAHESGIEVLAGPPDPDVWATCEPEQIKRIIDLLAQTYDFVLIDTRGSIDVLVRACVEVSTLTLLTTSGEVSSIRDTAAAIRRLDRWEIDRDRLKIVLNRTGRVNGFKIQDVNDVFGMDVFWQVPQDTRVPSSVQLGQPVVLNKKSAAGRNIAELARRIAGTQSTPTSSSSTFWRRLKHLGKRGAP